MSTPSPSIFRNALQVSPERIASLTDIELRELIHDLIRAQAYLCKSPLNEVRVNTEVKAPDGGCDGWSAKPVVADPWLGDADTCWQLKAGKAGAPADLAGEVINDVPSKTLHDNGRFVVVASGSTAGKEGEDRRLAKLIEEATRNGIPHNNIDVIGSERLTNWCNEHPAIALRWAARSEGLCSLKNWSQFTQHQSQWHASAEIDARLNEQRGNLDIDTGELLHLHIYGPPGVGKTRFAMELCKGAPWDKYVVYVEQAVDTNVIELLNASAKDVGVRLYVVVDEVQREDILRYRNRLDAGNGRIRLITIGHTSSPDPILVPALELTPLDDPSMRRLIETWNPEFPPEHVDFISAFSAGFVRLAQLASYAVAKEPSINVRGLLSRAEISGFLDKMLDSGSRRELYVLAALSVVGWDDDVEIEGEAIASHLKMDWQLVRSRVDEMHRNYNIAPRGGRYRYLSPTPLGNYLAVEAWDTYKGLLEKLHEVLPSEGAKTAYYERLRLIASSPNVMEFAKEQLALFFRLSDFLDPDAANRWAALCSADPEKGANNFLQAIEHTSIGERSQIDGKTRSKLVWTLVRLAWRSSCFHSAVMALGFLAEAENQSWANNATGEFRNRFNVFLGGTALPYPARLRVIDELIGIGRQKLLEIAITGLAQVANQHVSRFVTKPVSDEVPEEEWRPASQQEHIVCYELAFERLNTIVRLGRPELKPTIIEAADDLAMLFRNPLLRDLVTTLFRNINEQYPEVRESLRRLIDSIIWREKEYWKELSKKELEALEAIHQEFKGATIADRIIEEVGPTSWDRPNPPDYTELARIILADPETLRGNWEFLSSGNASGAMGLGEKLGELDADESRMSQLLPLARKGQDHRFICGYVKAMRAKHGDDWFNSLYEKLNRCRPRPTEILIELAWRAGSTDHSSRIVADLIRNETIDNILVEQLAFAKWEESLSDQALRAVLNSLVGRSYWGTAAVILARRIAGSPEEQKNWRGLALRLAVNGDLIRDNRMANHHWQQIAQPLAAEKTRELAAAILYEHVRRDSDTWFLEHSQALKIFNTCIETNPGGVWDEISKLLAAPEIGRYFVIGFPKGVIEKLPRDEVMGWVRVAPQERAAMIARLTIPDFSAEQSLASQVMSEFGDIPRVASAMMSECISGVHSGPSSVHWDGIAAKLECAAAMTRYSKLRNWASETAATFREMAERDRKREEEERLFWGT